MPNDANRRYSEQRTRKRRGETSDPDLAFKNVRYSIHHRISAFATRRMITNYFRQGGDIDVASIRASLLCPLSKRRIAVPARGADCSHVQCFDLEQFLQFQVQNSLWACPIAGCSKEIRVAQLRVDDYFNTVLETLSNRPDVTEIELLPKGSYSAVEPPLRAEEAVMDDGTPYVPGPIALKQEPLDEVAENVMRSEGGSGKNRDTDGGSPAAVATDEVDVIVIDDEEPIVTAPARRTRQRAPAKALSKQDKGTTRRNSFVQKDAELKRLLDELQHANTEIQRLRNSLAEKDTMTSTMRDESAAKDREIQCLRAVLKYAEHRQREEPPRSCASCEIRSLEEQLASVRSEAVSIKSAISDLELTKARVRQLEATLSEIDGEPPNDANDAHYQLHPWEWSELARSFGTEHPLYNHLLERLELQRHNAAWCRKTRSKMTEISKRLDSETHKVPDPYLQKEKEILDSYKRVAARYSSAVKEIRVELIEKFREIAEKKKAELAQLRPRSNRLQERERQLTEQLNNKKVLSLEKQLASVRSETVCMKSAISDLESTVTRVRQLEMVLDAIEKQPPPADANDAFYQLRPWEWSELARSFGTEHPLYNYFLVKLELQRHNIASYRHNKCKIAEISRMLHSDPHKVSDPCWQKEMDRLESYKKVAASYSSAVKAIRVQLIEKFREIAEKKKEKLSQLHPLSSRLQEQERQLTEKLNNLRSTA